MKIDSIAGLTSALKDLNRRYLRLRSPRPTNRHDAIPAFDDPALEFRALHRAYADLAWRHRCQEAMLCGLSLQLLNLSDEYLYTWTTLRNVILDVDRAAEAKILCAVERELARGWIELSTSQPLIAWAIPYMLQVASERQGVLYLPDLPSYERYAREAAFAWRVPEDFRVDELHDVDVFRDWLVTEGSLSLMLKHHVPLRLKDVSFWGIMEANEKEYPGKFPCIVISELENPEKDDVLPGRPLPACIELAEEQRAAGSDVWATIEALPASRTDWPEWAERFIRTAAKAIADLEQCFSALLNATDDSATEWPAIEMPPDVQRFVVRKLLPNRNRILEVARQLDAKGPETHRASVRPDEVRDQLMEYVLASVVEENELRSEVLFGERGIAPGQNYEGLLEAWKRSGVSLDEIERRRRAVEPLLLSSARPKLNPIVSHRMREAYRSFLFGLFSAAAVTSRAAVEAAAREYLMSLAHTDVALRDEIKELSLCNIEKKFREAGPLGDRLADLIAEVREAGNRAAHPRIGKTNEKPRQWKEMGALKTLRAAKAFIEELVALTPAKR